jgi:hypothetical protein
VKRSANIFTTMRRPRIVAARTEDVRAEPSMARYLWLVFSNPIDGEAAEYNRWYSEEHMLDVLSIDLVSAAQRFQFAASSGGPEPHQRYLAIYDIEANSPDEAMTAIDKARGTGTMRGTTALDPNTLQWYFRPLGPRATGDPTSRP